MVCQSATLKVAVDTSTAGGAMGSTYYPVNFTNTSATARPPRTGCAATRRVTGWRRYATASFSACASTSTPLLTVMPVRSGQAVRGVTP